MSEQPDPGPGVPLAAIASVCDGEVRGTADVEVSDVTHDSRQAGAGTLYACRPGLRADGHDFAPEAAERGAAALLVERWLDVELPQIRVPSVATAMGPAASHVHGDPSRRLDLYGITGSNGKTTTAYLLEAVLAAAGFTTGLIGTVETRIAGEAVPGVRTTPEATDLQRLLRHMVDRGVGAGAMEVSSHGLALGRVRGTRFCAVGFTNLSQDHLDFHRDMEDYFAAKQALFDGSYADAAVISVDDDWGRRLADAAVGDVVTVSTSDEVADAHASDIRQTPSGSVFNAHLRGRTLRVNTPLIGPFNVANALLALALAEAGGVDVAQAAQGLETLAGVPGRMQVVDEGQPFAVLVDYAHTPDAVERVLDAARAATGPGGRVIVVLGCGGDRDRDKRPQMGHAATSGADLAVLTSDNPRSEDPVAILDEIESGVRTDNGGAWEVEPDRRAAIARAIEAASDADVVVIAGKGHEATQEVAGVHHPFDDRLVAAEVLREVRR